MAYNRRAVRKLIEESFDGEELNTFCHDHFPEVYDQFTSVQTKSARVRALIDHVRRKGLFAKLVAEVENANPNKFKAFENRLLEDENKEASSKQVEKPFGAQKTNRPVNYLSFSTLGGAIAIAILISAGIWYSTRSPKITLHSGLRQALEDEWNITDLTEKEMANLTSLTASRRKINDITGLEHATKLTSIDLSNNRITNLQPLIDNSGLGDGDVVNLEGNLLETPKAWASIKELRNRGVKVEIQPYVINIPDENLRKAIQVQLELDSEPDLEDLERLETLSAQNSGIEDLSGLEFAINLTTLNLNNDGDENKNTVSDLSPIKNLTNLTSLALGNNDLTDISLLENLANLTFLTLSSNSIEDISSLVKLEELEQLRLLDNTITDISSLSGVKNLTFLDLRFNSINNLKPLESLANLTELHLDENPLAGDLLPLKSLTNLENLSLNGKSDQRTGIKHLSPIANLKNLKILGLDYSEVDDITPLRFHTNLENLSLGRTKIGDDDIEPLSTLPSLSWLNLTENGLSDIAPLANLKANSKIHTLYLPVNSISDFSPLEGLTSLLNLDIGFNCTGTGGSKKCLEDIGFLAGHNLSYLRITGNQISNLEPLINHTKLDALSASTNRISDIAALIENSNNGGLGSGDTVNLATNPLDDPDVTAHIQELESRGVEVIR